MATGALSSLGIGSSVLTYDIIEKLRAADEAGQVKPIERRIEKNTTQKNDLTQITSYLNLLKGATSALSGDQLFQGRDVSTSGESASLNAEAGVSTGNITVDVTNIASRDIYQSTAKGSSTTSLGLAPGNLTLSIGGEDYSISVTGATTLEDLATKINDNTNGDIEAKVMNVGGDTPYRLIIQSSQTGSDQAITFGDDTLNDDILSGLGLDLGTNQLSTAQNAMFKYDGIEMQRATNTIDDITFGLTLNLSDAGKTTFNITQNKSALADEMNSFVSAYNDLASNLNTLTDYDTETNQAGTLQGVSEVTSIKSSLNRLLTSMDDEGRTLSAYGLTLQSNGMLKFDENALNEKLAQDPTDVEDFFKGMTTYDPTTYTPQNDVNGGLLNFSTGDVMINGISILLSNDSTPEGNAQAFRDAINEANISGVLASLDSTGSRVVLNRSDGGDIEISGNTSALSSVGFNATSTYNEGNTSVGVFAKLSNTLEGMLGDSGSLTLFETRLTDSQKRLQSERERTIEQLDKKYEMMATQFAAYDSIIANLNNQFSALQSMIDAEANSKR